MGFLVILTALFGGFQESVRTFIFVVLGLMIMIFGFSRGYVRDYSYHSDEILEEREDQSA